MVTHWVFGTNTSENEKTTPLFTFGVIPCKNDCLIVWPTFYYVRMSILWAMQIRSISEINPENEPRFITSGAIAERVNGSCLSSSPGDIKDF